MCDYQASQQSYLEVHKQSVHFGKKYLCTICGQKVSSKSHLSYHIKSKHNEREHHCCDSCNKQFLSKRALSAHTRSVHQGITSICNICPYKTTNKSNLTKHIKVNTFKWKRSYYSIIKQHSRMLCQNMLQVFIRRMKISLFALNVTNH